MSSQMWHDTSNRNQNQERSISESRLILNENLRERKREIRKIARVREKGNCKMQKF